jgi:hypothetical protein
MNIRIGAMKLATNRLNAIFFTQFETLREPALEKIS